MPLGEAPGRRGVRRGLHHVALTVQGRSPRAAIAKAMGSVARAAVGEARSCQARQPVELGAMGRVLL